MATETSTRRKWQLPSIGPYKFAYILLHENAPTTLDRLSRSMIVAKCETISKIDLISIRDPRSSIHSHFTIEHWLVHEHDRPPRCYIDDHDLTSRGRMKRLLTILYQFVILGRQFVYILRLYIDWPMNLIGRHDVRLTITIYNRG